MANFLAGRAAGFYESMTIPNLFIAVTAFTMSAGFMFLVFSRQLNRLSRDTA